VRARSPEVWTLHPTQATASNGSEIAYVSCATGGIAIRSDTDRSCHGVDLPRDVVLEMFRRFDEASDLPRDKGPSR
jgi:hypothetical protein